MATEPPTTPSGEAGGSPLQAVQPTPVGSVPYVSQSALSVPQSGPETLAPQVDAINEAYQKKYFRELCKGETVEDRFSDLQGSKRWNRIIQIYSIRS